ncbi:hypothetical protein GP486_007444 [Trichoglossum hirsutum]|uniref:L-ornithine N(5)-monooxygenase [NAD(P)H] n=1 Tax=Trichoglossum hirsutum TaxID=265104 RepID=A0A9P8I6C7_9PEZI|nr:hypothetical protein GP486_007444 [Trichoglossum hirsutum]
MTAQNRINGTPPLPNGVIGGLGGLGEHQKRRGARSPAKPSALRGTHREELHDLICVGFGPASLAIAIALHDMLVSPDYSNNLSQLRPSREPKTLFLERQPQFAWHVDMLLPGAKMQISFIKDLATLRNPQSEFTFLNYLHHQNRLLQFSNLGTFNPLRAEYEDYMHWCAGSFEEVVDYSQEVSQIVPEKYLTGSSKVDSFVVRSRDLRTGELRSQRARHVVIAIGGTPRIPKSLLQNHPRIIHSSMYLTAVPALLKDRDKDYHIAVIGSGQSAAEVFNDLHSRYPNARTTLLMKDGALHPSDDSPFVNEIFHPSGVDDVYQRPPEVRKASIAYNRGTNYGVVCRDLLESLYADMYAQRLLNSNEEEWQHRIRPYRKVASIEDSPSSDERMRLHICNSSGIYEKDSVCCDEQLDVDAVLVATGYVRNAHEEMLKPASTTYGGNGKEEDNDDDDDDLPTIEDLPYTILKKGGFTTEDWSLNDRVRGVEEGAGSIDGSRSALGDSSGGSRVPFHAPQVSHSSMHSFPYVRMNEERAYRDRSHFRNKYRPCPKAERDGSSLSSEELSSVSLIDNDKDMEEIEERAASSNSSDDMASDPRIATT